MNNPAWLLFLTVVLFSCKTGNERAASSDSTRIKKVVKNDTLVVTERSAVFYSPDAARVAEQKKKIGEQDFNTGADDYIFYMNSALAFLDSSRLKMFDAKNKKYIRFVNASQSISLYRLDTIPELWGIFLFDPAKKPERIDIIDIEKSYKSYFAYH